MIDKSYTTEILRKLVQINSVNPGLDENCAGEEEVSRFILKELHQMDIEAELDEIKPGRFNVTGRIKGKSGGPSLMLNAHTDTVGVKGMSDPFSGMIEDGKLYGRGAYDMKGSIASMLAAAKSIREKNLKLKGDLVLSFVADEEFESIGAEAAAKKIKTDQGIVAEPTDLNICTAHRGFGIWKISVHGKTAHGGNHHLGIDANMNTGALLTELKKHASRLQDKKKHPLCGVGSLHVPLISGGRSLFIYSDECTLHVERRTLPGESLKDVESELLRLFDRVEKKEPGFRPEISLVIWRSPYEIDRDEVVVQQLEKSVTKVTGLEPEYMGHTWWEDSAIFGDVGIKTVIIGPKGGGIHEDLEWVELDSVYKLAEIFIDMAAE